MTYDKAFTHSGLFHSDDVFAAALLGLLWPGIIIERGTKVPEGYCGLVFDIGFGQYDHHQKDARVRDNGVPYAAFGLLWEAFGGELLCPADAAAFDEDFVQPLDLSDCTGAADSLAQCIADFNPAWDDSTPSNEAFARAVSFATGILNRHFGQIKSARAAYDAVRALIPTAEDCILTLDTAKPWKEALKGTDILYVIFPSARGGFMVQAVPTDEDALVPKQPFPEAWRGLTGATLETASGISGLTFCHRGGYLCAADTHEAALQAARKAYYNP